MSSVSREVAESEFERFGDMMALEFDRDRMDEDDRKAFDQSKARVVVAIEAGALVINDNGEPVYTPQRTEWSADPITFYEPDGSVYLAIDRQKKNQDMHKFYAIMAAMTKQSASVLSKLKGADAKLCQTVVALFLG